MAQSFDSLTAAQIAAGVAAGDFTATEVAQASLAAIEAREGGVQAFLQVAPDLALDAAARVDADRAAGKPLPPLAGVPLAIKDNMNLVGTRTTCASRMLEDYQRARSRWARTPAAPFVSRRRCAAWWVLSPRMAP